MPRGIPEPINLNDDQKERILEMAIEGATLHDIAMAFGFSDMGFFRYRKKNPLFDQELETVRTEASHYIVDSVLKDANRAETMAEASCVKAKLDVVKFIAGARVPKVYGMKQTIDINQTHDLAGALLNASRRVQPIPIAEPQSLPTLDITPNSQKTESENDASVSNSDLESSPRIEAKREPGECEGG